MKKLPKAVKQAQPFLGGATLLIDGVDVQTSSEQRLLELVRRLPAGRIFNTRVLAETLGMNTRTAGFFIQRSKLAESLKAGLWKRLGAVAESPKINYDFAPELMPKAGAR